MIEKTESGKRTLGLDQKMTQLSQVLDFQAYQAQPIVLAVTLVILRENG